MKLLNLTQNRQPKLSHPRPKRPSALPTPKKTPRTTCPPATPVPGRLPTTRTGPAPPPHPPRLTHNGPAGGLPTGPKPSYSRTLRRVGRYAGVHHVLGGFGGIRQAPVGFAGGA